MKLPSPFSIYDLRFTIGKKPSSPVVNCHPAANRQSAIGNRQSKKGIALVITLILLSVTLIMALALLALSNRERNSVTTTTDTAHAKLAADSALAAAQAEIIANIFATNNGAFNFSLLVSTNYINETNDYYVYTNGNPYGNLLTGSDFIEAATNQMIFPRAPVFLTNALTGNTDFRFYLDLNRNGVFDQNFFGLGFDETNGADYLHVGDPEWIGVLARPDAPHSANNQFIARYAFFAQPIGNGLDLNAIHNEASSYGGINSSPGSSAAFDGFLRNQGIGSWEINLAAFLADLNTNQWDAPTTENPSVNNPYEYNAGGSANQVAAANQGSAFEDARALLSYRYGFGYTNQAPLGALSANASFLQSDYPADLFPYGPLMTNTSLPLLGYSVNTNNPWAGSNNTNQFFDLMTELYDTSKVSGNATTGFTNHLINASTGIGSSNPSTYDRYTFYRMLSQLGTDSEPDEGKMNLNYSNVLVQYDSLSGTVTNITVIPGAETNLVSWTPTNFFLAAANRMLLNYSANWFANSPSNYLLTYYGATNYNYYHLNAAGDSITNDPSGFGLTNTPVFGNNNQLPFAFTNGIPAFGVTNIPVYVNGQFVYTPAVNRVLQLAANLYDASTNYFFPTVFRPTFLSVLQNGFTNVYIDGYQQVISVPGGTNDVQLSAPISVNFLLTGNSVKNYANGVNVYNVPWIIGAKKGFPNFNNFTEQNQMSVIRRLQVTRLAAGSSGLVTNQMYMMNLQSTLGADFWNSYASNFDDGVSVVLQGSVEMGLTNNDGVNFSANEAGVLSSPYYINGGLTYAGNGGISELGNGVLGFTYGFSTSGTSWPGSPSPFYSPSSPYSGSFITWSNVVSVLPYSVYRTSTASSADTGGFGAPSLIPTNWFNSTVSPYIQLVYETNGPVSIPGYQLPQFGLLTTNRLQTYIVDTSVTPNHVIDYVQLSQVNYFNVNANIFTNNADTGSVWNTNYGVANQILISAGLKNTDPADGQLWNTADATTSQNNFQAFIYGSATTNQMQAGYTPFCAAINYIVWAANDPLVHYTAGDLTPAGLALSGRVVGTTPNLNTLPALGIGGLNPNYYPWGRTNIQNPVFATSQQQFISTNSLSFWLKDPLAFGSINWDFPTNKYPSVGWIGRVHRGTPWQTVYLKSTDVLNDFSTVTLPDGQVVENGQLLWSDWTGDQNLYDAGDSAPVFDRQLFDLFTTALNDNASRGTLSVNVGANDSSISQADMQSLSAWSAVLSGVVVLTNIATSPQTTGVSNSWLTIRPAGTAGTNSALWQIVNNINSARTTFTNSDGVVGSFKHIGDVLSAPALTVGINVPSSWLTASPYLNLNASQQQQAYGISDEVYEQIPQQIMGLLRVSSTPRYVIYGYGQTLRPANKGLVLDSSAFGLVTNYQVVAESAVRAVVSVQTNILVTPTGFQTNYSAKVESYNVLPPN